MRPSVRHGMRHRPTIGSGSSRRCENTDHRADAGGEGGGERIGSSVGTGAAPGQRVADGQALTPLAGAQRQLEAWG
jgi:hypothetical protein